MITLTSRVKALLEGLGAPVYYYHPQSWITKPVISWRESGNREIGQADGREHLAELTYAKHCYFRALLLDVGVEEDTAEREACALEHAISGETFCKIRDKYPIK